MLQQEVSVGSRICIPFPVRIVSLSVYTNFTSLLKLTVGPLCRHARRKFPSLCLSRGLDFTLCGFNRVLWCTIPARANSWEVGCCTCMNSCNLYPT
jgi:hypothetical protein